LEKKSAAELLTSVDDLFTTQAERDEAKRETVKNIPIAEISDFPNHPFKVRMDEAMMEMAESVKQYGVLVPVMVRPKTEGGYEMVAGHRRKLAAELAQQEEIPCLVRDLTDDEAIIIMVDSNLQREKILPSEKAFAYKMKLEALNRQGQRTDLTCAPVEHKLDGKKSRDIVAEQAGESREQVRRYIRLTQLAPPLLDMVDEGKIAMRPAVELSYLPENEQSTLHETMEMEDCTPSHAQAIKMRKFSEEGKLNEDVILSIMQEEKPNQKEQVRIPRDRISKYFSPGTPAKTIEDTIIKALELYRKRQRDRER
jgi:ParB family chromosome partitioning protein